LDVGVGEQVVVGAVHAADAVARGELLAARVVARADRDDLDARRLARSREDLVVDACGGEDSPPHRTRARARGYVPLGHTPKGVALWATPRHARPLDSRPRREIESTVTASSSTAPVSTNFVPDESPSRPSPLSIEIITSAPRIAAFIVPRPPNSDVPPITAAAIGYSSAWPPPVFVSTDRRREASTMPPTTAMNEHRAKHAIRTLSTLMPARRAAS